MYVVVSMWVEGRPGICFRRGMMVGGMTAPALGILYKQKTPKLSRRSLQCTI